jgi:hypothetical protein
VAIISNAVTIADAGAFSVSLGAMTLIKTIDLTSAASTVSFVHGSSSVVFDSTYPVYKFEIMNAHPSDTGNQGGFQFNGRDGGSAYDSPKCTTSFRAFHFEDDSNAGLGYRTGSDNVTTGFQRLTDDDDVGDSADSGASGEIWIINPSSTTFATHFWARFSNMQSDAFSIDTMTSGYFNTTAAIDGIQFKFGSGNVDDATIKLYGIKDS